MLDEHTLLTVLFGNVGHIEILGLVACVCKLLNISVHLQNYHINHIIILVNKSSIMGVITCMGIGVCNHIHGCDYIHGCM